MIEPLKPDRLYRHCDPNGFDFETTADLDGSVEPFGLDRAVEAIRFGLEIDRDGYNIFALGATGLGRHALIKSFIEEKSAAREAPPDWCYVNNFKDPQTPAALRLPAGTGTEFRRRMETLIEEIRTSIPAVFEGEDYQTRRKVIEDEITEHRDKALVEIQEEAEKRGLTLLKTPLGLAFGPVKEGEVISPDEFQKLPAEEQEALRQAMADLQEKLQAVLRQLPKSEKEGRERLKKLNKEVAGFALSHLLEDLLERYADQPQVKEYLLDVKADVLENLERLLKSPEPKESPFETLSVGTPQGWSFWRRYAVNLLVDNQDLKGAPVVYEDNPTYVNILGRVEHLSAMGALVTDFGLVRPGALHRANGGYLILDAEQVLLSPYSWNALKRALRSSQIRIESLGQAMSLVSTVSLEPAPIPLDVKVILIGDPQLYYLLSAYDREFGQLFKVSADFDLFVDRNPSSDLQYARLVAQVSRDETLLPLDRRAVARVVERGSRTAGDSEKVSIHRGHLKDLLSEADHWARKDGRDRIEVEQIDRAIQAQIRRRDRVRERLQEQILRNIYLIDTEGEKVGQVNALSVLQLGDFEFGRPSRITARVRLGKGEVIDIEREVELGGPLHSKGVLILSAFLGARYASNDPLSLSATLVFEQSYGGIDGDSASSTELYALLSALSGLPIRQSLAVTGSVNQNGQVQAIGGVNEKIEGFFDICQSRGLTGRQGVLIPSANVVHLMLRHDVREAAAKGQFHIYPVATIDEGIEVLTGVPAGDLDDSGEYPEGSANRLVHDRLKEMSQRLISLRGKEAQR